MTSHRGAGVVLTSRTDLRRGIRLVRILGLLRAGYDTRGIIRVIGMGAETLNPEIGWVMHHRELVARYIDRPAEIPYPDRLRTRRPA